MEKVTKELKFSIVQVASNLLRIETSDKKHQYYTVNLLIYEMFCSCNCHGFKKSRLICKSLLAIIQFGNKDFQDFPKLYLDHPVTNLDPDLFRQSEQFGIPNKKSIPDEGKLFKVYLIPFDSSLLL